MNTICFPYHSKERYNNYKFAIIDSFSVNLQIFEKVKKEQPNFKEKFCPVNGDICQPGLGISQSDRETLENNVHVVFHSAATIRFDEPLRFVCPKHDYNVNFINEPRHEKTCLRGFRSGKTQTSLLN